MKKKNKISEWRKYNYEEKLWIPYFYIMYLYWWNYLKIAHQENRNIDWSFYKEWGGKNMFDVSFRTWWKHNWKKLFSQKQQIADEEIKYPMTTNGKNANAIKVALEVYRLKDKDNWEIVSILQKRFLPKKFYNSNEKKWELKSRIGSLQLATPSGERFKKIKKGADNPTVLDVKEENRGVKRYKRNADKIMDNVCKGIFP
jgi:hypothetical protein